MILTPFRYAGSKNKMLPILMEHLSPLLSKSNSFCDVFIGGGSVLLEVAAKYPTIKLFGNDKDKWVSSFWSIVASDDTQKLDELIRRLEAQPTIELFYKLRETPATTDIDYAYRALFFNRTCFSGILSSGPIGGREQKSKYKVDCRYNFQKLKKKILECNKLLIGRTTIDNVDVMSYYALKDESCVAYCDPPYVAAGKMLYPEYMTIKQHEQFSKIILSRKKWVLSYDNSDVIKDIYGDTCDIYDAVSNYCISGIKKEWSQKLELIIVPKL